MTHSRGSIVCIVDINVRIEPQILKSTKIRQCATFFTNHVVLEHFLQTFSHICADKGR